jgi:hypothetical protein
VSGAVSGAVISHRADYTILDRQFWILDWNAEMRATRMPIEVRIAEAGTTIQNRQSKIQNVFSEVGRVAHY